MSEDGGEYDKPKRRACTACHKCKSKCVYPPYYGDNNEHRCERCIRLGKITCVPHVSRQGKRKSWSMDGGSDTDGSSRQSQYQHHHKIQHVTSNSNSNQAQVIDNYTVESMGGIAAAAGAAACSGAGVMTSLKGGGGVGGGGDEFNSHPAAQQIQSVNLFAKSPSLLQQQQQQQLSILSRAIRERSRGSAASASSGAANAKNNNTLQDNFFPSVSGLSANLLAGMDPNTLSRMLNQLSDGNSSSNNKNYINNNSSSSNSNSNNNNNTSSFGGSSNLCNLNLLYQAANSQTNHRQQQGGYLVGVGSGGRNGGNLFNETNGYNISGQDDKRRNSTGNILPQDPLSNDNLKSPESGNKNDVNNDNNNTADSRLKKQKKYHKFPPEYPPISLLRREHSTSCTPLSSHAGEGTLSRSSSTQNFITPEDAIGSHYMNAACKHTGLTLASLKHHYGLQCQIREWISMALARRSFALLSKASSLAHRCDMHMDRILTGTLENAGPRMYYLLSMLLEPQSKIRIPIEDRHMLLPHFPPEFLSVIGCQNGRFFDESEIRNRWIIVRETRCGISRFFCSPAFERNVLCWAHVSQIYEDNLADIHSLIFVKDQFRRFLACNAYQIWSHSREGLPPRPVHAPRTRIRLLAKRWGQAKYQDDGVTNPVTKEMIHQVDDVMTLEMDLLFVSFPTMDKTTYYLEFFHSVKNNDATTGPAPGSENVNSSSIPRGLSNVSLNKEDEDAAEAERHLYSESPEGSNANPPTFDDIMESDEWVGIDDVMASGDINELMDALLN